MTIETQPLNTTARNPAWNGAVFYFLFWAALATYGPFVNVYYSQIGLTGLQIGTLTAISPVVTLTIAPLFSMLADRKRWRKRILTLNLVGWGLMIFLTQYPRTFLALFPVVLVAAIISSPIQSLANGLIARMASRHRVDFGKLRLWGSMSFAIFATSAGALWDRVGFGALFVLGGLMFIPVVAASTRLEESPPQANHVRPPLSTLLRDRGLVMLLIAAFFTGISESVYMAYSGIHVNKLGGGQFLVGALFGFSAFAEIPTMQVSGKVAHRIGQAWMLALGYALMSAAFLGYALVGVPWIMVLFGVFKGVGYGLSFIAIVAMIDGRAPEAWSATLQSLLTAASWGLAQLISAPLNGWIADTFGLPTAFLGAGIVELLAVVIVVWAQRRRLFDEKPLLQNEGVRSRE